MFHIFFNLPLALNSYRFFRNLLTDFFSFYFNLTLFHLCLKFHSCFIVNVSNNIHEKSTTLRGSVLEMLFKAFRSHKIESLYLLFIDQFINCHGVSCFFFNLLESFEPPYYFSYLYHCNPSTVTLSLGIRERITQIQTENI